MNLNVIVRSLAPCVLGTALLGNPVGAQTSPEHPGTTHGAAGAEKSTKSRVLGLGAEALQNEGPIRSIHAHVCGFHFYNREPQRAVRADHYCTHLNEDVYQCVIYDSDEPNARLIGVEYIISERLFRQLPEEEKRLWHSHRHEVKSGQLIAPDLPDIAEKELMEQLVTTYGKTWHLWQVDRGDTLPLGLPKLMMSYTADGQIDPRIVEERDRDLGIDSDEVRAKRADIPSPPVAPGADAWQHGDVFQISDKVLTPQKPPAPSEPSPPDN